jgi:fibronectin type 3 domain-containing protein
VNTGTTYWYKVRAYRLAGLTKVYGPYSDIVSARAMPAAITNPAAVSASTTGATVSWGGVTGASGYEIWRATADTGVFKLLKSTTMTSYTNTGLVTGQPYYYKVRAYIIVGRTKVYGAFTDVMVATPGT